jgi:TPR repeat protein
VAQDHAEAVKWWRLAAEQGDADAQSMLGFCYNSGKGVAQDHEEAVKWWRLAAEQGHPGAQQSLEAHAQASTSSVRFWARGVALLLTSCLVLALLVLIVAIRFGALDKWAESSPWLSGTVKFLKVVLDFI